MGKPRILIADSDPGIRRFVRTNLESHSYDTFMAMDGSEATRVIERDSPDLVILEVGLSVINGPEVLKSLRQWSQKPVIMLGEAEDDRKVKCLEYGADDYLSKPFGMEELLARIRNLLRRAESAGTMSVEPSFICGDLRISFGERRVMVANTEVRLTPTEYNLLQELALNADKVLTHTLLLNKVWGPESAREREYLRVFVGRLRKKLEIGATRQQYIITVPWVGYKLNGRMIRESKQESRPVLRS